MKSRFFIILAVVLLWADAAGAQTSPEFDRQVLGAIDTVPTRAELDASFPDAREQLKAAATDEGKGLYARQRAVTLLSHYADIDTRRFLEGLLQHKDPETRGIAVYTLGRTFGPTADAALVATIAAVIDADEESVAIWAARSLRWVAHTDAHDVLRRVANGKRERVGGVAAAALRKSTFGKPQR